MSTGGVVQARLEGDAVAALEAQEMAEQAVAAGTSPTPRPRRRDVAVHDEHRLRSSTLDTPLYGAGAREGPAAAGMRLAGDPSPRKPGPEERPRYSRAPGTRPTLQQGHWEEEGDQLREEGARREELPQYGSERRPYRRSTATYPERPSYGGAAFAAPPSSYRGVMSDAPTMATATSMATNEYVMVQPLTAPRLTSLTSHAIRTFVVAYDEYCERCTLRAVQPVLRVACLAREVRVVLERRSGHSFSTAEDEQQLQEYLRDALGELTHGRLGRAQDFEDVVKAAGNAARRSASTSFSDKVTEFETELYRQRANRGHSTWEGFNVRGKTMAKLVAQHLQPPELCQAVKRTMYFSGDVSEDSVEEVLNLALEVAQRHDEHEAVFAPARTPGDKPPGNKPTPKNPRGGRRTDGDRGGARNDRGNRNERREAGAKGNDASHAHITCFECNKKGHYAKDCPSKKTGRPHGEETKTEDIGGGGGGQRRSDRRKQRSARASAVVDKPDGVEDHEETKSEAAAKKSAKVAHAGRSPSANRSMRGGEVTLQYEVDTGSDLNLIGSRDAETLEAEGHVIEACEAIDVMPFNPDGEAVTVNRTLTFSAILETAFAPVATGPQTFHIVPHMTDVLLGQVFLKSQGLDVDQWVSESAATSAGRPVESPAAAYLAATATVASESVTPEDEEAEFPFDANDAIPEVKAADANVVAKERCAVEDMLTRAWRDGLSEFPEEYERLRTCVTSHDCWRLTLRDDPLVLCEPYRATLKPDAVPQRARARAFNPRQREAIEAEVDLMLNAKLLYYHPRSIWSSPAMTVPKPDETLRLVVDYRRVNSCIQPLALNMAYPRDAIFNLRDAKCFARFDNFKGYWQLPVHEDSAEIFTIDTPRGPLTPRSTQMGAVDSGSFYQNTLGEHLEDIPGVLHWGDDTLVYAATVEELIERVTAVVDTLARKNWRFKPTKCVLFARRVVWCGVSYGDGGMTVDPARVAALTAAGIPSTAAALTQLLGATAWISHHLPGYATVVEPLREVLNTACAGLTHRAARPRSCSSACPASTAKPSRRLWGTSTSSWPTSCALRTPTSLPWSTSSPTRATRPTAQPCSRPPRMWMRPQRAGT